MKSRFVIRLLAVMVVFYSFNNSMAQKNDWEKEGLKGRVKMVKTTNYDAIDTLGEIRKGKKWYYRNELFNVKGNLIEGYHYDSDGTLSFKVIYNYNDKENIIEEHNYSPDSYTVNIQTHL
jgi:hypothetical protein